MTRDKFFLIWNGLILSLLIKNRQGENRTWPFLRIDRTKDMRISMLPVSVIPHPDFVIESLLNLHWPIKCILVWVELHMDTPGSLLQEQG